MDRPESFVPSVRRIVAGAFTGGPDYAVRRPRGTTDWLLVNTVSGGGRFGPTGGPALASDPGDLVLIRPGAPHDYGTTRDRPGWELQFAHFHPRPDWLALLDWPEPVAGVRRLQTTAEAHRRITESFDRTVTLFRSGLAQAELFALNALEATLLWVDTVRPEPGHLDPRLVTVLEQISARLSEPLSTATLARAAGLSPSRLSHLFAAQLGTPPMRFVEQQRMRAAQQLLDLSSNPVAAVGRAVGYADPLYFSARFKRFCGRSPTAYRERWTTTSTRTSAGAGRTRTSPSSATTQPTSTDRPGPRTTSRVPGPGTP